jgi:hypothetical protein
MALEVVLTCNPVSTFCRQPLIISDDTVTAVRHGNTRDMLCVHPSNLTGPANDSRTPIMEPKTL